MRLSWWLDPWRSSDAKTSQNSNFQWYYPWTKLAHIHMNVSQSKNQQTFHCEALGPCVKANQFSRTSLQQREFLAVEGRFPCFWNYTVASFQSAPINLNASINLCTSVSIFYIKIHKWQLKQRRKCCRCYNCCCRCRCCCDYWYYVVSLGRYYTSNSKHLSSKFRSEIPLLDTFTCCKSQHVIRSGEQFIVYLNREIAQMVLSLRTRRIIVFISFLIYSHWRKMYL